VSDSIALDIEGYRSDPMTRRWALPKWGHQIAHGVLPLFVTANEHLFPVGTAFSVGRRIQFVTTAAHNIFEVFKHAIVDLC
jgi:hypothetical protein